MAASNCQACGAPMLWTVTHRGERMPVDPDPRADGNIVIELGDDGVARSRPRDPLLDAGPFHASHFSTCPEAPRFRKPR